MEFWIKDPFYHDVDQNIGFSSRSNGSFSSKDDSDDEAFWKHHRTRDDSTTKIRIKTRDRSVSPSFRNGHHVDDFEQTQKTDIIELSKPLVQGKSPSPMRGSATPNERSLSPFHVAVHSTKASQLRREGTKENKRVQSTPKSFVPRSPSPFHERLALQTTKAFKLRSADIKQDKTSLKSPKSSVPRSPSPFHDRLANRSTKAALLRSQETKENKKLQKGSKILIPRSPSPFHERLAAQTTKAAKLRSQETKENKRNKVQKPILPKAPSPLHERLATHATKSAQLRHEETKEIQNSFNKSMKNHLQFYCASLNSMSSNDSEAPPLVVSSDSSTLTFSSNSESEELSYMNDQQKVRGVSLRIDTQPQQANLNHFDRLAATNTKTMEIRRQLEQNINIQKNANRHDNFGREIFYRYPPKSPRSPKINPRPAQKEFARHSSAPPRNSVRNTPHLPPSKTLTPPYNKGGFFKSKESLPKRSPTNAHLDSLFQRLSKQDTIASSRKTVGTGLRPVILTEYEKMEHRQQEKIAKEKRKNRTSPRFFDVLSKDMTMSRLYKEYDEVQQRCSVKDSS